MNEMRKVGLVNRQARDRVPVGWLRRVAEGAVRELKIREAGVFSIAFVDERTMRRLNRQFMGHKGLTDVLSFRYLSKGRTPGRVQGSGAKVQGKHASVDAEEMIGEIVVSPAFARSYAKAHGLSYRQELARYVIHGLLHWVGYDDRTPAQQRRMQQMEDRLLAQRATAWGSSKLEVRSSKMVGSTLRTPNSELRA